MHRGGASAWRSNLVDTHGLLESDANIRAGDVAFRMSLGGLGDLGATEQRNHMFCHMKPHETTGKFWQIMDNKRAVRRNEHGDSIKDSETKDV